MSVLFLSCAKDDSSSNKLTSKEKALIGKWYNDTFESDFGALDMSCSTCYWEFLSDKSEDGVFGGIVSYGIGDFPSFFWGTGTDGEIYIMQDVILKVKSVTNSKLVLESGGTTFTFYREGFQPMDTDGDGVKDELDLCPNTSSGAEVDNSGCEMDEETYVPDDVFEQRLIDLGYDDVLDDYVLTSNILDVEILNLNVGISDYTKKIKDLTGIEGFLALKELKCDNHLLTSLEVSKNTALNYLSCNNNQLAYLDVSKNFMLKVLVCSNNIITSLNFNNTPLKVLACTSNQLTSLDVSKTNDLFELHSNYNPLTCIKVNQTQLINYREKYSWFRSIGQYYSLNCN